MTVHYSDDTVTLHHGDALQVLREMPDESVNCCVTSPPYYGLRDYGEEGQYGLEASPAAYVEQMRQVFAEVRRVLAADGTLWLNIGDSYYSGKGSPTQPDVKNEARRPAARVLDMPGQEWAKPKSLLGIPWRVAFALQDDGWILRNRIVWHKPNAMPEPVQDRLSCRSEDLFLFSKSRRYWFNLDAVREPLEHPGKAGHVFGGANKGSLGGVDATARRRGQNTYTPGEGRNPGDVWSVPTVPFPGAHFAVMPPELPRRCIVAGCKPGGVVLDPFAGSGTTGMVAGQQGRRFVGVDLSAKYLDLALKTRLAQTTLIDFGGAA